MSVVIRGCKNALRNKTRTVAVVLVLAVAVGMTLSMLVANEAVKGKLAALREGMDTTVTAWPGFDPGGDEPTMLTQEQYEQVGQLDHVDSVAGSLSGMLESPQPENPPDQQGGMVAMAGPGGVSGKTDLVSGIDAEAIGAPAGMVFPIALHGVSSNTDSAGKPLTMTAGEKLKPGDERSAILSDQLAKANDLEVGDTFTAFDEEFTVVGIAKTGEFDSVGVIIPIAELHELTEVEGYSAITAQVDDVDNLEAATSQIGKTLGKTVEVTSDSDSALSAVKGLQTVKDITWIGFLVSLLCATVIVFFTLSMTVRERRKEVGVLKAIGGTNRGVIGQFGAEAITLVLIGAVLGLGVAAASSNVMADVLVATNTAAVESEDPMVSGAVTATRVTVDGDMPENAGDLIGDITASVGLETLGLGMLVALVIAVLGSVVPAWLIARVRPAEVLRGE